MPDERTIAATDAPSADAPSASYFALARWLLTDYELPPHLRRRPAGGHLKAIVHLLLFFRNADSGLAWPHQATIAHVLSLSTRTVQRALRDAAAERLIAVERTAEGNRYRFPRITEAVAAAVKTQRAALEASLPRNCGTPWSLRIAKKAKAEWKIRPSVAHIADTVESALVAGIEPGRICALLKDHPGQLVYAKEVLGDAIRNRGAYRITDEERVAALGLCRGSLAAPEGETDV